MLFVCFKTPNAIEEEKKMNATYIISIARKLGCSIFLLPEDIIEVILVHELSFDLLSHIFHILLSAYNILGKSKDDAHIDRKHYVLDLETTRRRPALWIFRH